MNVSLRLGSLDGNHFLLSGLFLNDIVHARDDQTSSDVPNAEPSLWT